MLQETKERVQIMDIYALIDKGLESVTFQKVAKY